MICHVHISKKQPTICIRCSGDSNIAICPASGINSRNDLGIV